MATAHVIRGSPRRASWPFKLSFFPFPLKLYRIEYNNMSIIWLFIYSPWLTLMVLTFGSSILNGNSNKKKMFKKLSKSFYYLEL